jgi:hypothetical protein
MPWEMVGKSRDGVGLVSGFVNGAVVTKTSSCANWTHPGPFTQGVRVVSGSHSFRAVC